MDLITKSLFLSAYVCPKRVWFDRQGDIEGALIQPASLLRAQEGTRVGELARAARGAGVLVEGPNQLSATAATEASIAAGAARIFEAAVMVDDLLVRVDILERAGDDEWHLIEVKSATGVADEHLLDIAFQKYVLCKAEMPLSKCYCMHLNKESVNPDLNQLFVLEDVSEQVQALQQEIEDELYLIRKALADDAEPDIHISRHCKAGVPCRYLSHCWKDVPEKSIFSIPRLHYSKEQTLIEAGQIALKDVPDNFPLSDNQRKYVDLCNRNMVEIDTAAIRERVSELEFPIYFFDLETFSPAIPRFEGLRPYDSLCFQFSCHVLGEDEKVEHFEFLEQGSEDPRIPFVNALLKVIGWQGSVVVYNASFERARLNELAQFFPEYEPDLKHIIHRLWDQLVIFKHWYLDPRFGGSNSIKRVLPVLVPQLSYSELKIQQGDEASWKWAEMIELLPGPEKDRIAQELLEYCKMDTLAMLEIHKMISQV